ncbi:hypothetical protein [Streptomyces sp. ALI-76-A]|jgi:hypothetical protein|uniref:hypothetical protein n=1 Tax=Streptomyces sp. ALI-76-A TaxID=3025736 RepID=UPI00256EB565|nr:hypothetical protein [Streptomyces sp. ALI-76-A]MDL5202321.1 hypothetical protein [Streptomyces sp. ALI-76-A]
MRKTAEKRKPTVVKGEKAQRVTREVLGIGDRRKHPAREASKVLSVATLIRAGLGKGARRKAKLNQAIRDASWGELLRQLRYKCEWVRPDAGGCRPLVPLHSAVLGLPCRGPGMGPLGSAVDVRGVWCAA